MDTIINCVITVVLLVVLLPLLHWVEGFAPAPRRKDIFLATVFIVGSVFCPRDSWSWWMLSAVYAITGGHFARLAWSKSHRPRSKEGARDERP